jgi:hypothetical protein
LRLGSWFLALSTFLASSTFAQQGSPPTDEQRREASAHFRRGVDLFREGAYRASLVELRRAYEIAPDYRVLYNIGQVQLQLGDYLGATESYEAYLAQGGGEISPERRADVEKAFETLRERVGRVAVSVNQDGAEVYIDEQRVGVSPMPSTVPVNLGRHRVYARTKDGADASQVIDVAGGDVAQVKLELLVPKRESAPAASVEEPSRPLSPRRKLAIAGWAFGGLALGAAIAAGLSAQGKIDERKDEIGKDLPDQGKANDLGDSAQRLALTSDVLSVLAVAAVGVGAVLWLVGGGDAEADEASGAALSLGVSPGRVTLGGRF